MKGKFTIVKQIYGGSMNTKRMTGIVLLCIGFAATLRADFDNELIKSVSISKNRVDIHINDEFKKAYLLSDFFAEYDADINLESLDYSLVIMPFLMNVISIVWISGKEYYVDSMDEKLFHSLERIKQVFEVFYPHTKWDGRIIPRKLVTNSMPQKLDPEKNVALLYSSGLDSTTSSYYLADKHQLLITAWGAWDIPLKDQALWRTRKEQLKEYGKQKAHENTFLKSNYSSFLNRKILDKLVPEISSWRIRAVEGLGWAGLVAPILFLKGYQVLYIASSHPWEYEYVSAENPYIDDNIYFSDCTLRHHLFNFSRLQKLEWLAQKLKKQNIDGIPLKACHARKSVNCCHCRRCLLTITGLLLCEADIEKYGYTISPEEAIKLIKKFTNIKRKKLSAGDHFDYRSIVRLIKKKQNIGEPIPKDLLFLLEIEFDPQKGYDVPSRDKIDWEKLDSLFPHIKFKDV